ncbi:hypothetical protein J7337_012447 [Fusarium musae]|uniref:F-box domain-containing protein n=1 Tax=Fusarium musae TaxID=1042133 RepID=A0A9P8D5V1_9HYPO|nr:hypothetical protein J7337_012447 [Fusarium musae]KAG9495884.1 hypothetical protein J7337_012447 [Fusarium musae]
MASLQDIPNELVLMMAAEAPFSTLTALRLTCRRVQSLVSIAKHPVFASCVRKVGFAPSFLRSNWLGFEQECEARLNYGGKHDIELQE